MWLAVLGCLLALAESGGCRSQDVLNNPDGSDHANIRNFMEGGWRAVSFPDGLALSSK